MAQTSPTHLRLTLVDAGYLNPSNKTVNRITSYNVCYTKLLRGDKFTLTPRILPTDANNQNVNWTSSKPAVATVDNGVVTAVGAGETIITVTTVDGGKTATCVVTVASAPVTGVRLDKTSVETYVGKTVNLTATVLPTNSYNFV